MQRGSYREITELLTRDELDFAWVCGYPYARNKAVMRLLAMPLYRGKPLYQSYLIVPASDRRTESFADLKGAIFAYSDPNSNSGYLVPQYEMLRAGSTPRLYSANRSSRMRIARWRSQSRTALRKRGRSTAMSGRRSRCAHPS